VPPNESGAVSEDYRVAFDEIVLPVLRQFKPDVLLVSAGFDAHELDPLATMRLTTPVFGAMTMALRQAAQDCCRGRLALVTEGGYHLQALAASLDLVVQTLAAPVADPQWPASSIASQRGRASVAAARRALARFWNVE
jgi:acetoin utilization deacetylase AcuC-like enzyme